MKSLLGTWEIGLDHLIRRKSCEKQHWEELYQPEPNSKAAETLIKNNGVL
jgi:hypothetical protein